MYNISRHTHNDLCISSDRQTSHIISPFILIQTEYMSHPCDKWFACISIQNYCPKQTFQESSDPKGGCPGQKIIMTKNYKTQKYLKKKIKDNESKLRVYFKK